MSFLTRSVALTIRPDRIKQFLSTFTSQEKDLVNGIADIDLQDNSEEPQRKNMKYMQQLASTSFS